MFLPGVDSYPATNVQVSWAFDDSAPLPIDRGRSGVASFATQERAEWFIARVLRAGGTAKVVA